MTEPAFTLGVEEEYLLVDIETCDLVRDPPDHLMKACAEKLGSRVTGEFLRSQIEIGTGVCKNAAAVRSELIELRSTIAQVAAEHGMAPVAASTHPLAKWTEQHHSDKERYNTLAQDMQAVAYRMLICGMHVHVGIDDDDLRIDIMNQASYFLPHMLALSASSPFWQGREMGLKSYRLTVFDGLPRTGLPSRFESWNEYQRVVGLLRKSGVLEDQTKIWWDIRPHAKFPTLEMRICDVCTRLADAVAIAALFSCICRMLYRLRRSNQRWRIYPPFLVNENRWRAQRYGMEKGLIDFGRNAVVPFEELMAEMLNLVQEDAEALGCEEEIRRIGEITREGTSADRQLKRYHELKQAGEEDDAALHAVVRELVAETVDF